MVCMDLESRACFPSLLFAMNDKHQRGIGVRHCSVVAINLIISTQFTYDVPHPSVY